MTTTTLYTYTPNFEVGRVHAHFRAQNRYHLPEVYSTDLRDELLELAEQNEIKLNKLYIRKTPNMYFQLYSINHPLLPDNMRFSTSKERLQKLLNIEPQTKPVFNTFLETQLAKMQFAAIDSISLNNASYSTPCQWLKAYVANDALCLYFTGNHERIDWEYAYLKDLKPILNRY